MPKRFKQKIGFSPLIFLITDRLIKYLNKSKQKTENTAIIFLLRILNEQIPGQMNSEQKSSE